MDINKIFAEIGRMHLELTQLREQLAAAQARIKELTPVSAEPEAK